MPVRSSMNALIAKVSQYINDPSNVTFTPQNVQDELDRTRQIVRYEQLTPAPDIVPPSSGVAPGQFDWATYVSRFTDWEADEVLQGNIPGGISWQVLTPLTSDELTGRWTFDVVLPATNQTIPGQLPPVFITGKFYDPALAAAYLHEIWASMTADLFDFTSDGKTLHRSQRFQAHMASAKLWRQRAKPTVAHLTRGDLKASTAMQPVHLIGESDDFNR